MGILKTAAKVAAGTTLAQMAINLANDTIFSDKEQVNLGNSRKSTCYNCGAQIDSNSKFCPNCGISMTAEEDECIDYNEPTQVDDKDVFFTASSASTQGHTYVNSSAAKNSSTCPKCGAKMDSFAHICSYCGYEVPSAAPDSVKDLTSRLGIIESRKFAWHPKKKSALEGAIGMVLGKDEKEEEEREAAKKEFEKQKISEKKLLILNYPVPNSYGEIMEFMLLALSNINVQDGEIDEIEDVWISKMEQTYQRSLLVMKDDPKLVTIKNMYDKKMNEVNALKTKKAMAKRNKKLFVFGIIGIGLFMVIFGEFCGHATGDGNSPFYMVSMLGFLVAMGGVFPLISNINNKK